MKKMKKLVCMLLCVGMLVTVLCSCGSSGKSLEDVQKAGTLVMATSPDFPPFEYLENGKAVGIEPEIMEAIAQELGVTLTIEELDFESIVPGVKAGKFDTGVAGITITPERQENVDFCQPYFLAAQVIVVLPDSAIASKADLAGKKISVQTGTTAEDYCMEHEYDILGFTSNNDAVAALTAGKVEAWVVDNEVAQAIAAEQGLVVLDEAMTEEPYAFAFAKGSDSLVQAVDQALTKLLENGTIEAIFDKYETVYKSPLK